MALIFRDFDTTDFWNVSDYATKTYVEPPPNELEIAAVEKTLGYRLPASYIELMHTQNGGRANRKRHRTETPTTWAADHVALEAFFAIGRKKRYSLARTDGGSRFWIDEWAYPPIGVYFASCPSAGHDMFCLDYSICGPRGEPRVVHVDQEWDYAVTVVAETFEAFVRGLEGDDAFEPEL